MGREVKRVPMEFDWPQRQVWPGYLSPDWRPCPAGCRHGSTPEADALTARWYGHAPFRPEDRGSVPFEPDHPLIAERAWRNVRGDRFAAQAEARRLCDHYNSRWCHHLNDDDVAALLEAGRLHDLTHDWRPGEGWHPKDPPVRPTAREVNEWSIGPGFGHDSLNCWIVVGAEAERLGLPSTCPTCEGHAIHPDDIAASEAWEPTEPPEGDGWQMWETTSEGSPISPVFATPEDLARWLADTGASAFGSQGATYEQWLGMIVGPGCSVGSVVLAGGRMISGVEAAS